MSEENQNVSIITLNTMPWNKIDTGLWNMGIGDYAGVLIAGTGEHGSNNSKQMSCDDKEHSNPTTMMTLK